jgi:hypothetical protein
VRAGYGRGEVSGHPQRGTAGQKMSARARQLLAVAQGMPEASNFLRHVEQLCDLFRDWLHVEIDREEFSARVLAKWSRYNVERLTLDATTLAFIIEAAAHQTLTHEERATLVQRVETLNELLPESLRDIRAGKAGERHE